MNVRSLSAKGPVKLAEAIESFWAEPQDVQPGVYAIDKGGTHHALVFYGPDLQNKKGSVQQAADRFVQDAFSTGEGTR
jgi:hypothetical protein